MALAAPAPEPPDRRSRAAPERRTLVPHEHGAYGQMAMPLLTALAVGRIAFAPIALAVAAATAFVAHEALLVSLGQRGRRALEHDGARARRLLAILSAATALAGGVGLVLSPPSARWAALAPAALGAVVAALAWRKLEKTVPGEIAVASALSSCALAVALAGGASVRVAVACWGVWVLGFSAATIAVHSVLARAKSRGARNPGPAAAALIAGLVVLAFVAAARAGIPPAAPLAVLPIAAVSVALSLFDVSPKRLREVGWAMVGASATAMAILVLALRQ